MKFQVTKGEQSVILTVFIQDSSSTTGAGLGSLDQTSSITGGYVQRNGTGVALAVDQNVTTEGTYEAPSTAAQVRIGTPANMIAGTYELHFHNDLFTTNDWVTVTLSGATNMAPLTLEIQLVDQPINDATMWDGIQRMYDNSSGNTDPTAPASRNQVDNIGAASGGSINIQTTYDNTITDTINDGGGASLKGGGLVGIPVTGHAFTVGLEVTIGGTANYDGSHTIISETTNEVVITHSQDSETFSGSDTIISTVKTIPFVGSVTSGTFANTEALDSTSHEMDDVGNVVDIVYGFNVGGGRQGVSVSVVADVNGNNDEILLKVYDHVGTDWETIGTIAGAGGSSTVTIEPALLSKHTGTGSDLGDVYIRFDTDSTTPESLAVDQILVQAVNIGQSVGYALSSVWIDTDDGTAGTESFVNGVGDKAVLTLADAITIASNVGLHRFRLTLESSITFLEAHNNEEWFSEGFTLALGNQNVGGSHFTGADVTGIGTGSDEIHFDHCEMGNCTLSNAHLDSCDISGTITISSTGDYVFVGCSHSGGTPTIDFDAAVGSTTLHCHDYHGALTILNMKSGDILHFSSADGVLTLDSTCTAGTVNLTGTFGFTDNSSGMTINDVGQVLTKLPTTLVSGRMNSNAAAIDDSAPAAVNLKNSCLAMTSGAVVAAEASANTNTVFDTNLPLENDDYYGSATGGNVLAFIDTETNQVQSRRIVGSATGTSNTRITVEEAFDAIPVATDAFIVIGRITEI